MKKNIAVALLTILPTLLFAKDAKVSLAGTWRADTVKQGGTLEVGFSLLEKEIIVRDYITLNGYGGKLGGVPFGEASVGNKFQLGGRVNAGTCTIVPYGFLNAEFGLYGSSGKRFFASPFILDVGAGGGFELRYSASEKFTQSFFVEAGGGGMIMLKGTAANSKGYASLALGYRTYF